ncbi:regulatory protein TetR [[Leptolyngbya] sp. PCC 7376]|uniref:TetR/AcrR family transcriptional regulator n=1 Tax=[Leptolyngbya] sp. PCC 7376 TaxID=111781 RepID=UPI00029F2771|nr:TetR/AcrR family transcriptional regulator [[Leptolyngbya] sp. PCC 7376]AFY39209.1 regulatory protein TetR [[Leptolyngbya] sp. PCC 7376]
MVKKKENSKLGKQDWINLGLKVLSESGVAAVRVEPLAKLLEVTKGSFYWHFKNRAELLDALIDAWIANDTDGIIEQVEREKGDASAKLLRLFELAVQDDGQVENAIRAWARNEPQVAVVLKDVDQRRFDYTKNLFLELDFTPFEATTRARMVYYSLVGEFTLGARTNQEERLAEIRLQHKILTHRDLD